MSLVQLMHLTLGSITWPLMGTKREMRCTNSETELEAHMAAPSTSPPA